MFHEESGAHDWKRATQCYQTTPARKQLDFFATVCHHLTRRIPARRRQSRQKVRDMILYVQQSLYNMIRYDTIWYHMIWNDIWPWYNDIILYYMIWYYMIWYDPSISASWLAKSQDNNLPAPSNSSSTRLYPCPASLLAVEAAWVAWLLLLPKFLGADDADWLLKILLLDKIGGAGAALDAGVLGYPASAIRPISLEVVVDFKSVRGLDPIHLLPLGLKLLHGPPRTSDSEEFGCEAE